MAASAQPPAPKWLIDLPGMVDALRSRSNLRARIIDAIEAGEMLIKRNVSKLLKESYPDLYKDFKGIKRKKYATPSARDDALAAHLQESYRGTIGGIPTYEQFQSVSVAKRLKCSLITAGNSLNRCAAVAISCGFDKSLVGGISAV